MSKGVPTCWGIQFAVCVIDSQSKFVKLQGLHE